VSITSILSSHREEDIARNKHIVKKIIEVLILYGRQNITILDQSFKGIDTKVLSLLAVLSNKTKEMQ
jgi:hypothetical protein